MSIAMALAEKLHHTSRGQRFARAGEEGREEHYALRLQRPPPPQPELFQLYEEEPGGSRPACLVAAAFGRCTSSLRFSGTIVEQLADVVPTVQVLDAPGLPWGRLGWWTAFGSSTRRAAGRAVCIADAQGSTISSRITSSTARVVDRRRAEQFAWRCRRSYRLDSLQQRIDDFCASTFHNLMIVVAGGGGGLEGFSQGQCATAGSRWS